MFKKILLLVLAVNCVSLAHAMQSAGSAQESKAVVSAQRSAAEQKQLNEKFSEEVRFGSLERAQALFDQGADVNFSGTYRTPLWSAVNTFFAKNACEGLDLSRIEFLLKLPNIRVNELVGNAVYGETALTAASTGPRARYDFDAAVEEAEGRKALIRLLLAYGADPYIKNKSGKNMIDLNKKYPEVAKILTDGRAAYLVEQERIRKQLVEERRDVIAETAQLPLGVAAIAAGLAVDEEDIAACLREERKTQEETKKQ